MIDNAPIEYCANHPTVETHLRCNNCNKLICPKCAVRMPTGYRCRECVKGHQKVFDTTQWWDYPLAFFLSALLSFTGSLLAGRMGFFVIFLAPAAGVIIAEVVRFAVRRRRSPQLFLMAALGTALGGLPVLALTVFGALSGMGRLMDLIWIGLYLFTVTSTAYYRLGGIKMR